jgi:hypothetical protein
MLGVVRDGPLPIPAPYSIVQTLGTYGGLITEADDRWLNGVVVDQQLCGDVLQEAYLCSSENPPSEPKEEGSYPFSQAWESFTQYAPITCSSLGQFDGERLRVRAQAYLNAAGPAGIERALEHGVGDNKYLADSDAVDVGSGSAVDMVTAWALLEEYAGIATFGKGGAVIHVPPRLGALATHFYLAVPSGKGLISQSSGYPVIVGQGYDGDFDSSQPTQRKMYITGQLQVRRTNVEMVPDAEHVAWALDRTNNVYVYRAENYANVLFETCLQGYVTVDLSKTDTST